MARGGIRLTLGGWGHSVSAHWLEARARAPFSRLATRTNAISRTNRELRDLSDERATLKCVAPRGLPESPGGFNNEEADSRPVCDCVGSDGCTGGSSPNVTNAHGVHVGHQRP